VAVHKDTGVFADFYTAMLAVQQENGKVILFCLLLGLFDLTLAIVIAQFPDESVYLVPGVSNVQQTTLIWNFTDADIERILKDTHFAPGQAPDAGASDPQPTPIDPER
jgi:hypothetical protein